MAGYLGRIPDLLKIARNAEGGLPRREAWAYLYEVIACAREERDHGKLDRKARSHALAYRNAARVLALAAQQCWATYMLMGNKLDRYIALEYLRAAKELMREYRLMV